MTTDSDTPTSRAGTGPTLAQSIARLTELLGIAEGNAERMDRALATSGPEDGESWTMLADSRDNAAMHALHLRNALAAMRAAGLLTEALDLVPRISDDDPMAPALADWCRRVRAAILAAALGGPNG